MCPMTTAKWVLGAALLLSACGSGGGTEQRTVFRDSAGIRIAENVSVDDSAAHVWWSLGEAELDIGGEDAVEPYAVHRVSALLRQPDGSILVASSASADIRVFSATGEHLGTTGRRGGGPGEFQFISAMHRAAGDSVLIYDVQARRLTLLDPAGNFVRVIPIEAERGFGRLYGRFSDGTLLASVRGADMLPPETGGDHLSRVPTELGRFDQNIALIDSLGSFPGAERNVRVNMGANNQISSIEIVAGPFTRSPSYIAGESEFYVGPQDYPEVLVYNTSGTLSRIIRTGHTLEAFTQKHADAQFERQLSQASPQQQAQMKAVGPPPLPHTEFLPAYGSLLLDAEGNLWVADFANPLRPAGRWTVFGPDGAVLARVQLPERFRVFDIGRDYLLGRELDDLDVEHVRLYPLIR